MAASSPPHDPRAEAAVLASALREHATWQLRSGATGLPESAAAPRPSITEPPPSLRPAPIPEPQMSDPLAAAPRAIQKATGPGPAPKTERGPSPEGHRQLALLRDEVTSCQKCQLHETRTQTVFARGNGQSGLCFVGEGPGADEDAQGIPFVGKAGQLLDRMITAMGLSREDVYVCNIVKCRPPNNRKPEPDEMAACTGYLERQLEALDPEVIVALGATAVEGLLHVSGGITRLRGNWKLYRGRIAVMPTFHPAYLLRNPSAKHAVWDDMLAVLRQLGLPEPERKKS